MMRETAPALQQVTTIDLRNYTETQLANGVPVYYTTAQEEDLIRIEWRFHAGRWFEPKKLIARATSALMRKGTSTHSAKELADMVEFFGTQIQSSFGQDDTSVHITCLGKYLSRILPVVEEILTDAIYPEEELHLFVQRQQQRLRVSAQNTDFHANRAFQKALYGVEHPYGYAMEEPDLFAISRQELQDFHRTHYLPGTATIFIAGNVQNDTLALLEKHFGKQKRTSIVSPFEQIVAKPATDKKIFIDKADSVQSSVRIGGPIIPKTHPDFPGLNVLITAFGGYFGSRLMSNIREEKGYTYGIYSTVSHHTHASYFSIETEVGNEVCDAAIAEIYHEMRRMREEKMPEAELAKVKSYMMGSMLRATDGPFNRINVIRNMIQSGLTPAYYDDIVSAILNATPEHMQLLAQKYLNEKDMYEVVCGKKVG
ncbi:MAG: pitrilysin family protein [Chitinophagales bacterium]